MRLTRAGLTAAVTALVTRALFLPGSTPAVADPVPPQVGWWAGQTVGFCGANDPTSCPRDLTAYTPAAWDALEAGNGFLNFNVMYTSDFGPTVAGVNRRTDAIPVIREANERGIPVTAWITAPLNKGVFANENNAQTMQDAVQAFHAWATANALEFEGADLDLEFPLGYQALYDAIAENDISGLQQTLSGNLNPGHQCAAVRKYRETIAWAHSHDLELGGSPVFFTLDDFKDGNLALADLFDLAPMLPEYDALYLQAYRAFGVDLGSGFVATYFNEIQQRFGAKGQVSLGNTGIPPYNTAAPVVADVRMLAAMGATKIPIFDFASTVQSYGVAGVTQILAAANNPMSPAELAPAAASITPAGTGIRAIMTGLDTYAATSTPFLTWLAGRPQFPNTTTSC